MSPSPSLLSKKPAYVVLDWQSTDYANDNDGEDDEDETENDGEKNDGDGRGKSAKEEDLDLPEPGGELGEKWCTRVSDIGHRKLSESLN